MNFFILILLTLTLVSCADADTPIKKRLMLESQSSYDGTCPCPFSLDKAGKRCDEKSEHTRTGGKTPVCYENDVTIEMVQNYKKKKGTQ